MSLFCFRERLEDLFKVKKERWKGLNKYVKEFHKRKERIHKEKIDRIQREKINLLKNNDVEGYLRMVQVSIKILIYLCFGVVTCYARMPRYLYMHDVPLSFYIDTGRFFMDAFKMQFLMHYAF